MPERPVRSLNAVSRTLMIPLYIRAMESRRPDAIVRDPKALALIGKLDYDFSLIRSRKEADQISMLLRMREFDRMAREFLTHHPDGLLVDLGCGLDTRFDRMDNGRMEWYGLDLPEVIELRRGLLDETPRSHLIGRSVLDFSWMDDLSRRAGMPFLFLAEGVLYYLKLTQAQELVRELVRRFPGAELIFDAFSPVVVRLHPHPPDVPTVYWGLKDDRDVEAWAPGARLLGRRYYFDQPEPRLGIYQLMRLFPFFARVVRIVHYRLGESPAPSPASADSPKE